MANLVAEQGRRIGPAATADAARGRRLLIALGLGVVVALNVVFIAVWLPWAIRHGPWDFPIYRMASERLFDGTMYDWGNGYIYPYSPVFAWLFAPIATLGIWVWRLAHIAALAIIPSWPVRIAVALSWPFWMDTWEGNTLIFVAVLGFHALRGNRWAGLAFLALALLIPRPLVLPAVAWLLWRQPGLRVPFALMFAFHAVAVLLTGYGPEWIAALPGANHDLASSTNLSPSHFLGLAWLVVGVPLAAWLTWRGRVAWAGLALSPYLLPNYLLIVLLSLRDMPPPHLDQDYRRPGRQCSRSSSR
jgi:hypothetical protein